MEKMPAPGTVGAGVGDGLAAKMASKIIGTLPARPGRPPRVRITAARITSGSTGARAPETTSRPAVSSVAADFRIDHRDPALAEAHAISLTGATMNRSKLLDVT